MVIVGRRWSVSVGLLEEVLEGVFVVFFEREKEKIGGKCNVSLRCGGRREYG